MDARIGILNRDGKTVYYAFAHGHNKPAVEGSRKKVEAALGLAAEVSGLVGQVIPAGIGKAQWMIVTSADAEIVRGHRWSARKQKWNKTKSECSRDAIFKTEPKCEQPNAALGLLRTKAKKTAPDRDYIVTLLWKGGKPEEITIAARDAAEAIKRGREWKNEEYGRTLQCNTLPCSFRARRAKD